MLTSFPAGSGGLTAPSPAKARLSDQLHDRNERIPVFGAIPARPIRQLVIETLHKGFDLALHGLHLGAHIQDDLDAGQVYAEVARQMQDHLQTPEVLIGIEPRVSVAAAGLQQSLALVEAERLRMHSVLLRH